MNSAAWALALHDLGFQVIVAPLRGKRPNIAWKHYQTERVPREQVEAWFAHGEHNLALISGAISGTVVVDGDSPAACEYIELITPPTMKVITTKGAHYYFRHPGGRVPNSVRVSDDPPIDLRGDGGLTIGPGSLHASGNRYRLPDGEDLWSVADLPLFNRDWFDIPQAKVVNFQRPSVFFASVAQKEAYEQAQRYLSKVPPAVQGQGGDNFTYIQACRLVRGFNLSDDEALGLLSEWNSKCAPPWSEADLAQKVRHARAYGSGEFGAMIQRQVGGLMCSGWPK